MNKIPEIPEIPNLPDEIVEAINKDKLVIFVGAGVSTVAGAKSWSGLAANLFTMCKEKKYVDAQQYDILNSKIKDEKQKITISYELFKSKGDLDSYYKKFEKDLEKKDDEKYKRSKPIFDFCKESDALVLSTNCDTLLDPYFNKKLVFFDKINKWPINGPALVKIHGSLEDRESLVFTTAEYLRRYSDEEFKDYLKNIFNSDKTILFIGYGMSEFELLEYMLSPLNQMNSCNKVFMLKGYFTYEYPLKEHMDLYYDSMKIKQIAFNKDKNSYDQLVYILSDWIKTIENNTALRENRIIKFRALLNDDEHFDDNLPTIQQIMSEEQSSERIIFEELSQSEYVNKYIEALKDTLFVPDFFFNQHKKDDSDYKLYCLSRLLPNEDSLLVNNIIYIIDKYLEYIINDHKCLEYRNVINALIQIVCKFKNNPLGERFFEFIDLLKADELPYGFSDRLIIEIIRNNTVFKQWNEKSHKIIYEIALNLMLKNGRSIYRFKKFNDTFDELYYHDIDMCCFVFASLKEAIKSISEKNSFKFWHVGSVAKHKNKYTTRMIEDILIEYFRRTITKIPLKELEVFVSENYEDNCIIPKFQVFAIAERYNDLKSYLYKMDNPFKRWMLYSDLYYLIEKNNDIISDSECEILVDWIVESNFEKDINIQGEYINVIKNDYFKLLLKKHSIANEYISNMDNTECKGVYPEIYERNCGIRFFSRIGPDNDEIIEEMSDKSIKEIAVLLESEDLNRHSVYDYGEAVKSICKNNLAIFYDDIESIALIPNKYLTYLIQGFCENSKYEHTGKLICALKKIYYISNNDEAIIKEIADQSFIFLSALTSEDDTMNFDKELYGLLFECMQARKESFIQNYSFPKDFSNEKILIEVLNNCFSIILKRIIDLTVRIDKEEYKRKTIGFIDSILNLECNNAVILIKSRLSMESQALYIIDSSWLNDHLSLILDDFCSFITFAFSNNYYNLREVFGVIKSNNYIDELIRVYQNSTEYEQICISLVRFIVVLFFKYEEDVDWIISPLINSGGSKIIDELLIDVNNISAELIKKNDLIVRICRYIQKIKDIKITDYTIEELSMLSLHFQKLDDSIWQVIELGTENDINYISDSIVDLIEKQWNECPQNAVKILVNLIKNTNGIRSYLEYNDRLSSLVSKVKHEKSFENEFHAINSKLIAEGITDFI